MDTGQARAGTGQTTNGAMPSDHSSPVPIAEEPFPEAKRPKPSPPLSQREAIVALADLMHRMKVRAEKGTPPPSPPLPRRQKYCACYASYPSPFPTPSLSLDLTALFE